LNLAPSKKFSTGAVLIFDNIVSLGRFIESDTIENEKILSSY